MRGNTATICVTTFRAQWDAGMPMVQLCQAWTITKDQLIRLKTVWDLPLRHDRGRKREPKVRLSRAEIRASEESCDLAPAIAAAAARERERWTLEQEHARRGSHSGGASDRQPRILPLANLQAAMRDFVDDD
jgi:hypothetical protein